MVRTSPSSMTPAMRGLRQSGRVVFIDGRSAKAPCQSDSPGRRTRRPLPPGLFAPCNPLARVVSRQSRARGVNVTIYRRYRFDFRHLLCPLYFLARVFFQFIIHHHVCRTSYPMRIYAKKPLFDQNNEITAYACMRGECMSL